MFSYKLHLMSLLRTVVTVVSVMICYSDDLAKIVSALEKKII